MSKLVRSQRYLCRAFEQGEVTPKKLLLVVLMQEQSWRYRPPGSKIPTLRDRLIEELGINRKGIAKKARAEVSGADRKRRSK